MVNPREYHLYDFVYLKGNDPDLIGIVQRIIAPDRYEVAFKLHDADGGKDSVQPLIVTSQEIAPVRINTKRF